MTISQSLIFLYGYTGRMIGIAEDSVLQSLSSSFLCYLRDMIRHFYVTEVSK